jgi:pyroglutamyl-peptidase
MNVLLTGFEPFGGSQVNPSAQVVRTLARDGLPGVALHSAILPVDRQGGPATLLNAVRALHPDAIVCLGEATRRMAISIERVAINLLDYRMADNAGHQAIDEPIVPDGPAAYFVTLPVRAMLEAVRAAGIPAELSLSAGAFLCNQVTYELLHYLTTHQLDIPAGFVHLPALPEQVTNAYPPMPSMALATMTCGIRAVIGALQVLIPSPRDGVGGGGTA